MPLEPIGRITDGTPVDATTTNAVFDTVDARLRYLYDLIRDAGALERLVRIDQIVNPEAVLRGPVYFDETTNRFEPAIAQVQPGSDGVVPADATRHWGILRAKRGDDRGDILLSGYDELDVSDAIIGSDKSPGVLYLSAATPGKYSRSAAFPSVAVCHWDGTGVLVRPFRDDEFVGRHEHLEFDLACRPAGTTTPPDVGERHVISVADPDVEGWLPADHASFDGNAPAGAAFGYNIAANAGLAAMWPPLPLRSAGILLDRGEARENGGSYVPIGMTGLVVIDENGIWWMSDCNNDAPWPSTYDSAVSEPPLSEGYAECPRQLEMRMKLVFSKPSFATGAGVVTSLTPDDARIETTCNGVPAFVGPLRIKLKLESGVTDEATNTAKAIKLVNADGTFKQGNVVAGLVAGASNVLLSSSASTPADVENNIPHIHHGVVAVTVIPAEELFLTPVLFRTQNAAEDFPKDVMVLTWRQGQDGDIRGLVNVPMGLNISLSLKLRFWLMGYAAGTLPSMLLTMRRIPQPAGTPLALPTTDTAVAIDTAVAVDAANKYFEVDSASFVVAAGDSVFFTLTREGDGGDGYAADVGMLKMVGVLATS